MTEQARINAELQTLLVNGIIRSNDNMASLQAKLIDSLPAIAESTRSAGRELVVPIGNTCRVIAQFAGTPEQVAIDEAEADVIRSKDSEVGDVEKFKCLNITEVNTATGHCILKVDGFDAPIVGKISDPSLATPNNVYTKALNAQTPFEFSAKPVKRGGVIKTLYISDAKASSR